MKNSLAEVNPQLAKEWHPTKNGNLTPADVAANSHKEAWWYLPYNDPNTGRHFNFEWKAQIGNRNKGNQCPYLSGQAVLQGYNDLLTTHPELAKEWHPIKNGDLKPSDVTYGCGKKVWWYLPYNDPETGKQFNFEWQAKINNRSNGAKCPYLTNHDVWVGYNDLSTLMPNLAKEWHPTKNKNLKPTNVTVQSNKKVWWMFKYKDPSTNKTFEFEWLAAIRDRTNGDGCPYLSGHSVRQGFNDLETINPELAKEWDGDKNGELKPKDVTVGSHKNVWWKCKKGHSWKAKVYHRHHHKNGCPHCSNEVKTSFPEQIIYYYMKKIFPDACNGDRKAINVELDVYIPSISIAIEYDGCAWHKEIERDVKKNEKCKEKKIHIIRIREIGCPEMVSNEYCTVFKVKPGDTQALTEVIYQIVIMLNKNIDINIDRDIIEIQNLINYTKKKDSLAELYPEVAKEWHPTKNGNLRPENVKAQSNKNVWWLLPYNDPKTGKHFDFEWEDKIPHRTKRANQCPYLSGHKVWVGFNDLPTLNPVLTSEWNYEKNKGLKNKRGEDISTPDKVTPGSHQKVWWKCHECGHEWEAKIENRSHGRGCPMCYKNKNSQNNED